MRIVIAHKEKGKRKAFSKGNASCFRRELTTEQAQTIDKATTNMTKQQREILRRRQERVPMQWNDSLSSRGEGPSKLKGKGIDPREWGGVNISRDSLDLEALESFVHQHKTVKQ